MYIYVVSLAAFSRLRQHAVGIGDTHETTSDHLASDELDVSFILVAATQVALRENIAQIVGEETRMPTICQSCVFVLFDSFVDVQAIFAELAQQCAPEVRCVRYVCYLIQLFG